MSEEAKPEVEKPPAAAPTEGTEAAAAATEAAPAATEEVDVDVDALLAQEDPEFVKSMAELKKAELVAPDAPLDSLNVSDIPGDKDPVPAKTKWLTRVVQNWLLFPLLSMLSWLWQKIKGMFRAFAQLSGVGKLTVFAVLILLALLGYVLKLTLKGGFLPTLQTDFINSWGRVADHRYEFTPEEKFESFDNPMRHPEYVVLIDKVVVNLKPGDMSDGNPMGMFEFYVEAASREAAVELGDRSKEVLDLAQRTVENMTYDELITPEGKIRLKLLLQRNLNAFLTQGRVRKVFFKSIVLKP